MDDYSYVMQKLFESFFIIKSGEISTAPPNVNTNTFTKTLIIKILKYYNIPLHEKYLTMDEIVGADEIFITGIIVEVVPILSFNGYKIDQKNQVGKVTHFISHCFKEIINGNLFPELLVNVRAT